MKTVLMNDSITSATARRKELGDVEMRRKIEEHIEKQRLKAIEGDLAELY